MFINRIRKPEIDILFGGFEDLFEGFPLQDMALYMAVYNSNDYETSMEDQCYVARNLPTKNEMFGIEYPAQELLLGKKKPLIDYKINFNVH